MSRVTGRLEQVEFIPAAGAAQPTDAYDVTLPDQYGRDVLLGVGANVSNVRANTAVNVRTPLNAERGTPKAELSGPFSDKRGRA